MLSLKKILISCLLAATMVASPLSVFAAHVEGDLNLKNKAPDPAAIVADLIVARPLGLIVTIAGSVIYIVAAPFAALGGNHDETVQSLVISPAEYTFKRPLGRFDDY